MLISLVLVFISGLYIMKIFIYIDGASRGNPGLAACAAVFKDADGKIIKQYSKFLGTATNNIAEYEGLILALQKAKQLFGKEKISAKGGIEFEIRSDSELLVNQLNGNYKIEDKELQKLFIKYWNLKTDFGKLKIIYIPREKNKEADKLVNNELNSQGAKLF